MKKLDISGVTDAAQIKIKKGTLQFLQDANYEAFQAIVIGSIGNAYDPAKIYVLFGCVNSGAGNAYNITAGAVFYAGEIFLVDASVFSTSGSYVGVFRQVISQFMDNADPVTFTDNSVHNVHNIRKMQIVEGATGSGVADYSAKSPFTFAVQSQINIIPAGSLVKSGTYPNITLNVPAGGNMNHRQVVGKSLIYGSGALADLPDLTIVFTPKGTSILIMFSAQFHSSVTAQGFFVYLNAQGSVVNQTKVEIYQQGMNVSLQSLVTVAPNTPITIKVTWDANSNIYNKGNESFRTLTIIDL
jgi:hypothetical protein